MRLYGNLITLHTISSMPATTHPVLFMSSFAFFSSCHEQAVQVSEGVVLHGAVDGSAPLRVIPCLN